MVLQNKSGQRPLSYTFYTLDSHRLSNPDVGL